MWTTGYDNRQKLFAGYASRKEAESACELLNGWGAAAFIVERKA